MSDYDIFEVQSDGNSPRPDSFSSSDSIDDDRPRLLLSLSQEQITQKFGNGIDIGLAPLWHSGEFLRLELAPVPAAAGHKETRFLAELHRVLGLPSSTQRWALAKEATIARSWLPKPGSDEHPSQYCQPTSSHLIKDESNIKYELGVSWFWSPYKESQKSPDDACVLTVHPWSQHPIQIYAMPEQRPLDNKLSLMTWQHLQLVKDHQHYFDFEDDLVMPRALRDAYTACSRCRKEIPADQMSHPCLFHRGVKCLNDERKVGCEHTPELTPPNSMDSVRSNPAHYPIPTHYYVWNCCQQAGDYTGCMAETTHTTEVRRML